MASTTTTATKKIELPTTMKACVATGFGDIESNLTVHDHWGQVPHNVPPQHMIVKVLSCALAPGDVRVLSGKTAYVQLPHGHPYIPGSDVSGIVVKVHEETEQKFHVNDYVICRFDEPKPQGGLAEYRLVKTELSEKCPSSISPNVACGLSASSMAAKRVVRDFVSSGHRVLIVGGSGAVGTSMIQYATAVKDTFVATVSTQNDLCTRLGAHKVVDYRTHNWWDLAEFQNDPFDVVIDLVNGNNWQEGGCSGKAIKKRSGVYVALMSGVATEMECHGVWDMVKLVAGLVRTLFYSRLVPGVPKWCIPEALKLEDGDLKELLEDVESGILEPILDPASPFTFTNKGVHEAFALQKSTHAHGKVVVEIASM